MDEPEPASRPGRLILALLLAATAVGCRASAPRAAPKRAALPPQSVSQAAAPPPPAAEAPVAVPVPKSSLVVIDEGAPPAETKQNIVDAARAEKARRQDAQAPIAVIDNKNLGQYAAGQKLTVANPEPAAPASAKPAAPAVGNEDYWRKRGLELRTRWHDAVDRIAELQRHAATLRDRFYATDDPYVRDGEVKPAWDRVLEQIRAAELVIEESRQKVADYLDEGRRAGVFPGWLREGVELEPTVTPPARKPPEPGEPVVVQEPPPA